MATFEVRKGDVATPRSPGYSLAHPIPVGGGLMFGPFNQECFLASLRDRDGMPVSFAHLGSVSPAPDRPPVDLYNIVRSDGTTLHLFLDMYAPCTDTAPDGFTFARDAALDLPKSLVRSLRVGRSEPPLDVHRRWRIVNVDTGTEGHIEWTGGDSVAVELGPDLPLTIRPDIQHLVASAPLAELGLVLDDYVVRVLPITSGGRLRGFSEW
jgi:hypothetical protein